MDYKISLKAARVNAELTQKDVAKYMNVTKETISNWENAKSFPKANSLVTLCEFYGVPLDNIFLPKRFN